MTVPMPGQPAQQQTVTNRELFRQAWLRHPSPPLLYIPHNCPELVSRVASISMNKSVLFVRWYTSLKKFTFLNFFDVLTICCARVLVSHEKIVFMTTTKYPRLSVRLSPSMKRRLELSSISRHISQGSIVRDALKKYFVGSEFIDGEF